MQARIPWRAFLAWVDCHVLPYSGGILEQPYPLWHCIETMARGFHMEKKAHEDAELAKIKASMQRR